MNKNVEGKLNLEDFRNNLVLSFNEENPMGTVFYNLDKDDSGKQQYYYFNCTRLYFRMPGEHKIDNKTFDMELQFNCTGEIPGDKSHNTKFVFVAVPVVAVNDTESQSNFFDNFNVLQNEHVSSDNFPYTFLIDNFDDILNPFNMFNKVFFYTGSVNYPECMIGANWIVIENQVTIRKSLLNAFFSLLDPNQIKDGNNRKAVPNSEEYFILENNFNVLTK
jgi:carbonic anhydrase